jgi:hypothetical protein
VSSDRRRSNARAGREASPTTFRFPCGHLEAEPLVTRRLRSRDNAVWIDCARCNVIVVLAAPGDRWQARPGFRSKGRRTHRANRDLA